MSPIWPPPGGFFWVTLVKYNERIDYPWVIGSDFAGQANYRISTVWFLGSILSFEPLGIAEVISQSKPLNMAMPP